jgi:hypothetical protein
MIRFLLVSIILIFSLQAKELLYGTGSLQGFGTIFKNGVRISKLDPKSYSIELSRTNQTASELFLDFENKKAFTLKDKNGKYRVLSSNYTVITKQSKLGKRYASFSARNSKVAIETNPSQLLGSSLIQDKFFTSFFIIPGSLEQESNLVEKIYITGGKKYGFECLIQDNKLLFNIHNMFRNHSGRSMSFSLKSDTPLKSGRWTHVAISFDPEHSRVSLFENGERKDTALATDKTNGDIISLGFHSNDTGPLFIGKKFYGKMDNFFIGLGSPDFDFLNTPYKKVEYDSVNKVATQVYGEVYSDIVKTDYSNSFPADISHQVEQPEGTHYEVLYRLSDKVFEKNSEFPKWKNSALFLKTERERFQYFQWKVLLRSDYSGKNTPVFRQLKFRYAETTPPDPPVAIRIEQDKNSDIGVCLYWNSNHEDEVKESGGYIIHYGVSPERMVASIYTDEKGERITGLKTGSSLEKEYKSLSFCINNSVVNYNSEKLKDKNLLTLQRGITYYFKVSAYNKFYDFGNKTGLDQKSKPSKPVLFTFPRYSLD